jgi:hypothetical protein
MAACAWRVIERSVVKTKDEERRRLHGLLDVILERASEQAIEAIRLDSEMVEWSVLVVAEWDSN